MVNNNNNDSLLDMKLSIAIMSSFVVLTFQYLLLISFNLLGTSLGSAVQTTSKIVVAIFFIYAFPAMWKNGYKNFLIVYIVAILIFASQFLFYTSNRPFLMDLIFPIFFIALPAFTYTLAIKNLEKLHIVTRIAAKVVFLFGVIISIFIYNGNSSVEAYSMSLSYYMLLPALIFLNDFFDRYKINSAILFIITLVIIISLGSRGALLGIIVFALLNILKKRNKTSRKSFFIRSSGFFAAILMVFQYDQFINWFNEHLINIGITSRTLILSQGNEIHLSGRENLYSQIIREISAHPIIGIGIGGDRLKLNGYTHNFFLEILANFGVIVGSILLILLLSLIIRAFFLENQRVYIMLTFWFSLGFVHLIVSSSYLTDMKFWVFMGLLINVLFSKSENKKFLNK